MASHSPIGSEWHRWDLHFHTPASYDYQNKGVTNQQLVDGLIAQGIRVIAITDHHRMDVDRIAELQKLGGDKLTVLPGIEFCSELGGSTSVHYIGIFPEDSNLQVLWTKLSGSLNITEAEVAQRGDQNIYCPFVATCNLIHELDGLVTVHAGKKSNSIEELKNSDYIKQIVKRDLVKDCIDAYEVGSVKDPDAYVKNVFPHLDAPIPLIICSDNHNILQYEAKAPLWLKADPTFRGLLMVLKEPADRIFIGSRPPHHIRVEQNKTKYIKGITFNRKTSAPADQKWFSGSIAFNPGLVAIVGNKGSGKSALADAIGLLGSTKNSGGFSFLSDRRFRHPKGGHAKHFEAVLEWHSAETTTRGLQELVQPGEVERLKFLPQDHVETVCNELVGVGEQGFEAELKAVIFSHVTEAGRLGQTTLDALVQFQTGEKQKRIDTLLKQLRSLSRTRAQKEASLDQSVRTELDGKLQAKEIELQAHDKEKPTDVAPPEKSGEAPGVDSDLLKAIGSAEQTKATIENSITASQDRLKRAERKQAVAGRLLERLTNFQKDFDAFKEALREDATEVGLSVDDLATLSLKIDAVSAILEAARTEVRKERDELNEDKEGGLKKRLAEAGKVLAELQAKLDEPNQRFQAFLKASAEWNDKKKKLEGTSEEPDSIAGLKAAIAALNSVPEELKALAAQQLDLAIEIHTEKLGQTTVYRTLYEPVQKFIEAHPLSTDQLRLEFRAELADVDFADRLLALISMGRRGSFMGTEAGQLRANQLAGATSWEDADDVRRFITEVDRALHFDLRSEEEQPPVPLSSQMLKGHRLEEVFDMLYGMDYIQPKYVLKWDGKDLQMLSPGERGILLLVFYLLIDQGDMPLVIDQPEGNLDNYTVSKVLVDCIREARQRRQVFIVTHNPNLAVVTDADQVIHASIDKPKGNEIQYVSGALENPKISRFVTDVLEGTRWAFDVRGVKYDVGAS